MRRVLDVVRSRLYIIRKIKDLEYFPCGIQYLIKCVEDFSLCRLTILDLSDLYVFLFSS